MHLESTSERVVCLPLLPSHIGEEMDPLPADSTGASSRRGAAKRIRQSLSKGNLVALNKSAARERALRHWDLLRLHYLDFPLSSRRSVEKRWLQLVQAVKQQVSCIRSMSLASFALWLNHVYPQATGIVCCLS